MNWAWSRFLLENWRSPTESLIRAISQKIHILHSTPLNKIVLEWSIHPLETIKKIDLEVVSISLQNIGQVPITEKVNKNRKI